MDLFLRAKHWQLFIAFVVLPLLIGMFIMVNMMINILRDAEPDPVKIFNHLKFLPLAVVLFVAGKMCWQWAVAIRLQRYAPPGVQFKNGGFKILFWFVILFYPALFFCVFSFIGSIPLRGNMADPNDLIWFVAIFPLSIFNTFCMFYCYYSSAKTYKTIELQRQVTFSDFVLEFMLIWFFFVGVWILQPKINKMIAPDIFSE